MVVRQVRELVMLDNQFGVASPGLDLLSYSDSVSYVNIACNRLLGGPVTPDCRPGTATLPPRTRRTTTWRTPAASPDTGNLRAVLATGSGLLLLAAVVRMLTMMMVVISAANRLIGEVVQSRRRPLLVDVKLGP